jgi:hypothetical protein
MKNSDIKVVSPEVIREFDRYLVERKLRFECVIVGATSLSLANIISRRTKDCDVLDPEIPKAIKDASMDFATVMRSKGIYLVDDWFNNGPASLKQVLPQGWRDDLEPLYQGQALSLQTLDRLTLLKTKLFAYCDRGEDLDDCLALKPSLDELDAAKEWVQYQDANPMWPDHVENRIEELAEKLGLGKEKSRDRGRGGEFDMER